MVLHCKILPRIQIFSASVDSGDVHASSGIVKQKWHPLPDFLGTSCKYFRFQKSTVVVPGFSIKKKKKRIIRKKNLQRLRCILWSRLKSATAFGLLLLTRLSFPFTCALFSVNSSLPAVLWRVLTSGTWRDPQRSPLEKTSHPFSTPAAFFHLSRHVDMSRSEAVARSVKFHF